MKRYKDYMDGVEASDTLHEKLKHLEEPKKKSRPWAKWGGLAAALVLVAAVGAYGLSRGGWDGLADHFDPAAPTAESEIADIPAPFPDPVPAIPNSPHVDPLSPPDWMDWGYEVVDGEMAVYYAYPFLICTDASAQPQTSLDYSLAPPDAVSRNATWDDVLLFMGGEKAMADHLLWDGLNWEGTIWFEDEFTPCAALLYAEGDDMMLTLEVMKGGKVPSCVVLPDKLYWTNWWQGVEITALHLGDKYEISFFCNGTGYKLTLYANPPVLADELCGRFVRYAVAGGFSLSALPFRAGDLPNKGRPTENEPGANILHPGDPGYVEPFPAPDSAPQTTPYNPSAHN